MASTDIASGSSGVSTIPVVMNAVDCHPRLAGTRSIRRSPTRMRSPERATMAASPRTETTNTQFSDANPASAL